MRLLLPAGSRHHISQSVVDMVLARLRRHITNTSTMHWQSTGEMGNDLIMNTFMCGHSDTAISA